MYCYKCGSEISDKSRFCSFCGSNTDIKLAEEKSDILLTEKNTLSKRLLVSGLSLGKDLFFIIIIFLFVMSGVIEFYSSFSKELSNDTFENKTINYFVNGDDANIQIIRFLATLGNTKAQINLGYRYYLGKGVQQDSNESIKWMKLAANQGNTEEKDILEEMDRKAPSCGSSESKSLVMDISEMEIKKQLKSVLFPQLALLQIFPPEALAKEAQKKGESVETYLNNINAYVDKKYSEANPHLTSIRIESIDDKVLKSKCVAVIEFSNDEKTEINYTLSYTTDGKLYAEVFGL